MKSRNGLIEFYRFLFACIIVLFHGAWIGGGNQFEIFRGGYLGVEFFFVLSGFYLAKHIVEHSERFSWKSLLKEVARRYGKLFPYMLPAFLVLFAFAHLDASGVGRVALDAVQSLYEVLLLCMLGTIEAHPLYNPPIWYCSVLLICVAVFYFLAASNYRVFARLVCPVAIVCIYGYLALNYGNLDTITDKVGVFYTGLLRGFAAMAVGASLYELIDGAGPRKPLCGRFLSLFASVLLLAFLLFACWHSSFLDFPAVLAAAGLIYLALASPWLAGRFDAPVFILLGRLSLPLYVAQWIVVKGLAVFPGLEAEMGELLFIVAYLALCFGAALTLEFSVKTLKRIYARLAARDDVS